MQRSISIVNSVSALIFWTLIFLPQSVLYHVERGKDLKLPFNVFLGDKEAVVWICLALFIIFTFTDINFLTIVPSVISFLAILGTILDVWIRPLIESFYIGSIAKPLEEGDTLNPFFAFVNTYIFSDKGLNLFETFKLQQPVAATINNYFIVAVILGLSIGMIVTSILSIKNFRESIGK